VLFLDDFPPVYPLLALSDAYLGDFSSIGYDFLRFDRPMYFFNPSKTALETDRGRFLHRCGLEIPPQENAFDFIARTWEQNRSHFAPIRQQIYAYAFGQERTLTEVREAITDVFSRDPLSVS
jgi:teichoic acid glycerol-phosphate primase